MTKNIKSPQEIRKANYKAQPRRIKPVREQDLRADFRRYFIKIKRKLNLDASLEDIIWLHFKAAGFTQKESFDNGIRHFGYKI